LASNKNNDRKRNDRNLGLASSEMFIVKQRETVKFFCHCLSTKLETLKRVSGGRGNFAPLSGVGEMIDLPIRPDPAHASAAYFNPHPRFWVPVPAAKSFQPSHQWPREISFSISISQVSRVYSSEGVDAGMARFLSLRFRPGLWMRA
jgi:hypothetical protein